MKFSNKKTEKSAVKGTEFVFPGRQLDLFTTALQCDWDEDADFRKFKSSLFACNYQPFGKKSCKYVVYDFFRSCISIDFDSTNDPT